MQNAQSVLDTVKALMRQSEIDKAIDVLLKWEASAKIGIEDELIAQSSRLTNVQKEYRTGGLSFDDRGRELAKISSAMLSLVEEIPGKIALNAQISQPTVGKPAPQPFILPTPGSPLRFVLIYDIADDKAREQLDKQLFLLVKTKKIALFNPHKSDFGGDVETQTRQEIETADYILCLFSSNLFSDTTPWLTLLLEAVENGKRVIPIRISDMSMEGTGLEKLRSLPSGNRLVANFPNADAAYADIAAELRKLVPK